MPRLCLRRKIYSTYQTCWISSLVRFGVSSHVCMWLSAHHHAITLKLKMTRSQNFTEYLRELLNLRQIAEPFLVPRLKNFTSFTDSDLTFQVRHTSINANRTRSFDSNCCNVNGQAEGLSRRARAVGDCTIYTLWNISWTMGCYVYLRMWTTLCRR